MPFWSYFFSIFWCLYLDGGFNGVLVIFLQPQCVPFVCCSYSGLCVSLQSRCDAVMTVQNIHSALPAAFPPPIFISFHLIIFYFIKIFLDESSAEFPPMPAEVFNVRPGRGRAKNKTERGESGGRKRERRWSRPGRLSKEPPSL